MVRNLTNLKHAGQCGMFQNICQDIFVYFPQCFFYCMMMAAVGGIIPLMMFCRMSLRRKIISSFMVDSLRSKIIVVDSSNNMNWEDAWLVLRWEGWWSPWWCQQWHQQAFPGSSQGDQGLPGVKIRGSKSQKAALNRGFFPFSYIVFCYPLLIKENNRSRH